jgi:hypothetical protein
MALAGRRLLRALAARLAVEDGGPGVGDDRVVHRRLRDGWHLAHGGAAPAPLVAAVAVAAYDHRTDARAAEQSAAQEEPVGGPTAPATLSLEASARVGPKLVGDDRRVVAAPCRTGWR